MPAVRVVPAELVLENVLEADRVQAHSCPRKRSKLDAVRSTLKEMAKARFWEVWEELENVESREYLCQEWTAEETCWGS